MIDIYAQQQAKKAINAVKNKPTPGLSLLGSMENKLENQVIYVISDSTGSWDAGANKAWPLLLAEKIAANYPAYNVKYAKYNDDTGIYSAFRDISVVGEERHLLFNGSGYVPMLDSDTIPITSPDLDIAIKCAADAWSTGSFVSLISKIGTTGNKSFNFILSSTGKPSLMYYDSTDTLIQQSSSSAVSFVDGETNWLRATLKVDNGAGGSDVKFYTSVDGLTWSQHGSTITTEGVTTLKVSNAPWNVGGYSQNGAVFKGKIFEVIVRDGIDGRVVSPISIDVWYPYPSSTERAATLAGTPTVYMYNCSLASYGLINTAIFDDTLLSKALFNAINPIVFISLGHNDPMSGVAYYMAAWDTLMTSIKKYTYNPYIVMMSQNPETPPLSTYENGGAFRRRNLLNYARLNGYDFIDVYTAFYQDPRPLSDLVSTTDGIHPTIPAGCQLWCDTIWKYLNVV